jgi:uncharacterized protein involved in outer membrane biogenesis
MIRLPKRPGRWIAAALALLAASAIAVPYLGADGFAAPIKAAMEQALGRKVDINGRVRFQLVPRPGFSMADVVIHENPKLGVEPFAYVIQLNVSLALSSLWNRRIEFARLQLVEPSINLMKVPDGPWNVQSLLAQAGETAKQSTPPPTIEVSAGRINFKAGEVKSRYYLADADLLVEAADPRRLSIRLRAGQHRPFRGLGRFPGGSVMLPASGTGPTRQPRAGTGCGRRDSLAAPGAKHRIRRVCDLSRPTGGSGFEHRDHGTAGA